MEAKNIPYIERTLRIGGEFKHQSQLLDDITISVVLAEPGAGKSDLLLSLATSLGTTPIRASQFRHKMKFGDTKVLIVDGLDEVAKIDQSAIDGILVKAAELNPEKIIFASRSAQWEEARTRTIKGAFGEDARMMDLSVIGLLLC